MNKKHTNKSNKKKKIIIMTSCHIKASYDYDCHILFLFLFHDHQKGVTIGLKYLNQIQKHFICIQLFLLVHYNTQIKKVKAA
jgi:hypothetical protein